MKSRLITMNAVIVFSMLVLLPSAVAAQSSPSTPNGKPDFSGVWAGPAFRHRAGPGDTDTPGITRYDPKLYSDLFKPGGKEIFYQKWTGNLAHDDPQSLCLPIGFPRVALSPYAQQILQPPGFVVILDGRCRRSLGRRHACGRYHRVKGMAAGGERTWPGRGALS